MTKPNTPRYVLGIDVGTSFVKSALYDRDGSEVALATRRIEPLMPRPDWSEIGMETVWQAVVATVRETTAKAEQIHISASQIGGLGISANMVGAWIIDQNGSPVRDAILWNDGRTQRLIDRLNMEQPGFMSLIFRYSGSVMQQGCTLPVMRWLHESEPHVLKRARAVLCCKDWLRFKMTGTLNLDSSEASVLPGNTRVQDLDPALLEMLGVSAYRYLLPPVLRSEAVAGELLPTAATALGLSAGIPVVTGAGDVPSTLIGASAVEANTALTILGTTCLNCMVMDQPSFEPADTGLLFYMPGQRWARALVNIAGTTNLDWFVAQICGQESSESHDPDDLYRGLEAVAEQSDSGARGLIYLPYLSAVGIIAPIVEPAARADFFGLTNAHTRADMLRAVYEGVALSIRDCYGMLPTQPTRITLAGGGSRSRFWSQLISDCCGVPVDVPEGSEFGARGAALLAATGIGWFPDVVSAGRHVRLISRSHEPDPRRVRRYDDVYEIYEALRENLRAVWRKAAGREA